MNEHQTDLPAEPSLAANNTTTNLADPTILNEGTVDKVATPDLSSSRRG